MHPRYACAQQPRRLLCPEAAVFLGEQCPSCPGGRLAPASDALKKGRKSSSSAMPCGLDCGCRLLSDLVTPVLWRNVSPLLRPTSAAALQRGVWGVCSAASPVSSLLCHAGHLAIPFSMLFRVPFEHFWWRARIVCWGRLSCVKMPDNTFLFGSDCGTCVPH